MPAPPEDVAIASDEVFQTYRALFEFDPVPLDASVAGVEENESWRRERITFRAAYADDEVVAYLFLPVAHQPPYQTVVYFPGASSRRQDSPEELQLRIIDFLITSGRAVMYPIYLRTHERRHEDPFRLDSNPAGFGSRALVDYTTTWISDLTRSIDYMMTRDDIRADKLAYFGFSWGGHVGPLALALEPRFAAGVLLDGGLPFTPRRPEIQPRHFAPRVEVPVLMLNGIYDAHFPLETSQKVLFELLGTPPEHKKHVLYESSHVVFVRYRNQAIGEILDWLDTYLGPVN
jgi:dienelactone hydrolase